jgi:hypothetical protein
LVFAVLKDVQKQTDAERVELRRGEFVELTCHEQHAEAEGGKKLTLELRGLFKCRQLTGGRSVVSAALPPSRIELS